MNEDRNIPLEWNTESISNGFGFLTIPIDRGREEYLRDFYRVGQCILITIYNEVKKQIMVPVHLHTLCEFPHIPGDRGSLVHWMRVPGSGQLVVTGVFLGFEKFGISSEKRKTEFSVGDKGSVSITKNLEINGYQIAVRGSKNRPGEILLVVTDGVTSSELSLGGSGITVLKSDSLRIESENLSAIISDKKSIQFDGDELLVNFEGQSIKISANGVIINSDKVISLESKNSSVSITDRGIVVETDKQIYLEGDKPALYAKSTSSTEIVDLSEIGVSKNVRIS